MEPLSWILAVLFGIIPIAIVIRRASKRKHPSSPVIANSWTTALETETKEQMGSEGERDGELHVLINHVIPANIQLCSPLLSQQPLPLSTEVLRHYRAMFGTEGEVVQEEYQPVPIAIYPPTRKRGWWTYATVGLHQAGGSELLLYSYNRDEAMVQQLKAVAAQVRQEYEEEGKQVDLEDQFTLSGPIISQSRLDHITVVPATFEEEGFVHYFDGENIISFFALLPITEEEAHYLRVHGWEALVERFVAKEVNALDLLRNSSVDGGEVDGSDTIESKRRSGA